MNGRKDREFWTPARIEQVTALWLAGKTGSQCGAELGCTRNAVIGKVWRLKLKRQKPVRGASDFRVQAVLSPMTTAQPRNRPAAKPPRPVLKLRNPMLNRDKGHSASEHRRSDARKTPDAMEINSEITPGPRARPWLLPPGRPVSESSWLPLPGTTPISLEDTTLATCHWPIGPQPVMFCGATVSRGAYCAAHGALAYQQVSR